MGECSEPSNWSERVRSAGTNVERQKIRRITGWPAVGRNMPTTYRPNLSALAPWTRSDS